MDGVRNFKFYGFMKDKPTNISVTSHLVAFATFVGEGMTQCVFLGLQYISDG